MTTNTSYIKSAGLTFLLYLAVSVVCSIVLTVFWQFGIDTASMTNQELMLMAETSPFIKIGSAIIGATSAVLCAFILSLKKNRAGYQPAVIFAILLTVYGALSILLHPEHTLLQQASKLLSPVPLCLLGAWLSHRLSAFRSAANSRFTGA